MSGDVLDTLAALAEQSGDADDVLRAAVDLLVAAPHVSWVGIRFVEEGDLVAGPSAGTPDEMRRRRAPIAYRGDSVGELVVDGDVDDTFLARAADLLSEHVLLGWDTGGEEWVP